MTRTVEIEHGGHPFEVAYEQVEDEFTLKRICPTAGVDHRYGTDFSDWMIDHAWEAYKQIEDMGIQAILAQDAEPKEANDD